MHGLEIVAVLGAPSIPSYTVPRATRARDDYARCWCAAVRSVG